MVASTTSQNHARHTFVRPGPRTHKTPPPPPHPPAGLLQRAEWIKFLGAFFNLDSYASNLYTAIEDEFNKVKVRGRGGWE